MRSLTIIIACFIANICSNAVALDFANIKVSEPWRDFIKAYEKEAFTKKNAAELNSLCTEHLSLNPDITEPLRGCIEYIFSKTDGESSYVDFSQSTKNQKTAAINIQLVEPKTLYIYLPSLTSSSHVEISDKIRDLIGTDEPELIVLDLRDNGGGAFAGVKSVAGLFMPDNSPIFKLTSPRDKKPIIVNSSSAVNQFTGYPKHTPLVRFLKSKVIVITDPNTASGAEALTSALREKRGAKQMGETSAGKSTVFTLANIAIDTAVQLKTHEMVSINNKPWSKDGLAPHLTITDSEIEQQDRGNPLTDSWLALVLKEHHKDN